MAVRQLLRGRKVVAYMPNLQAAVNHFRSFSSYDESEPPRAVQYTTSLSEVGAPVNWPDKQLGPLGEKDKNFPLPGHVGISRKTTTYKELITKPKRAAKPAILRAKTPTDRHVEVMRQFEDAPYLFGEVDTIYNSKSLECVAQECSPLMRKDFKDLFPEKNIRELDLTVITISQRTMNDMTGWSEKVEEEREKLLDEFVSGSKSICEALKENGYWADFIDPSSGRPFLGPFTNDAMFETDERYRKLGFEINDLGCCKVIEHHKWGTHAYVGCIFTDAPVYHPILAGMVPDMDSEYNDMDDDLDY